MDVSPSPDLMSHIPLELMTLICEYLCDHCILGWDAPLGSKRATYMSSKPLLNLCLVSKRVRQAAQPVLFHFFCESATVKVDTFPKFMAFADSMMENRFLAQKVKCLSLAHLSSHHLLNVERLHCPPWSYEECDKYDLHTAAILERTTQLEQLEVFIGSHSTAADLWIPSATNSPCLKEFNVHATYENHRFCDKMVSAFLFNKPRLSTLRLSNFAGFDDSFFQAVGNIKHLSLNNFESSSPPVAILREMIKAMPRLESLKLCTSNESGGRASKVGEALLVCKESLRALTLHKSLNATDASFLQQFTKLHELDLTIKSPLVVDGECILPSQYLKRLTLRCSPLIYSRQFAEGLGELFQSLHKYPQLEVIHVVLHQNFRDTYRLEFLSNLENNLRRVNPHVRLRTEYTNWAYCCAYKRSWGFSPWQRNRENMVE